MDVWIVIDRYDHSEVSTSVHMTAKGALIQAYHSLLEVYDGLCPDWDGENEFKVEYPTAYEFVEKNKENIEDAKKSELDKYFGDLTCFVGEWTERRCDISINLNRLRP